MRGSKKEDIKQIIKDSLKEILPDLIKEISFQVNDFKIPKSPEQKDKRFCYWTASINKNGTDNGKMTQTLVTSARKAGVLEDFHVYSPDMETLDGGTLHKVAPFDIWGCWFKLDLLLNEVSKLDYEYMIWLDADHYFVRKPRKNLIDFADGGLVMIPMENQINSDAKRDVWWSITIKDTIDIFRECGVKNEKIYNTNGGLFIVRKDFIKTFHAMCYDFRAIIKKRTGIDIVEEYCLAIMGNLLNKNINLTTQENLEEVWACDWTSQFTNTVPAGQQWRWENFLSGESKLVNSDIVHVMKGKPALVNKKWN